MASEAELNSQAQSPFWDALGWTVLIGQFVFAVFVSLMVAVAISLDDDLIASAFIGFLFVQILLSAVGISLAPVRLITRALIGTGITLFFCICMYRCAYRDGGGHDVAFPIVGAMLGQWILFQIPLWILRFQGWKLVAPGVQSNVDRRKEVQFGIRHLLIWTTVVAVFMAVARFLLANLELSELGGGNRQILELGANLTLGNSLIAVPIIVGCLSRYYFWFWILVSVFVCAGVCLVQYGLFTSGPGSSFVMGINITQATMAILAMLAVRMTGFRLNRDVPDTQTI